jgi:hypothetical protein
VTGERSGVVRCVRGTRSRYARHPSSISATAR